MEYMTTIVTIRRNALRSLIPPPHLQLSEWIESNIRLPEGVSRLPPLFRVGGRAGAHRCRRNQSTAVISTIHPSVRAVLSRPPGGPHMPPARRLSPSR